MIGQPTVAEERRVLLTGRAQAWSRQGFIDETTRDRIRAAMRTQWKPASLFSRLVFFVLTLVCVAAFFGLLQLADFPMSGTVTAAVAIALAEFLIIRRKFFHIGPEEGLYLGGLTALNADLDPDFPAVLLVLAAIAAVAGVRVMNDLFIAAASLLVAFFLAVKFESGTIAAIYCVALAVFAFILMSRPVERPFLARILASIILLLPPAAYLFFINETDRESLGGTITFALLGVALTAGGLRQRFHSALFSGLLVLGLVIGRVAKDIPWPAEAKLIMFGIVALAIALVIERTLRTARNGLTARRIADAHSVDLVEAAALGGLGTAATVSTEKGPEMTPGEGEFGGGGASGRY